ncbi:unnamed protein product [Notodromas monacha]|uniref:Uncharacterized protein n=1 Tax=Notodromas monacha TaxID=399045 RepID=A0A7R9GIH3_9CRUS|nr:unnamed protein product [Notodromas monacha]CAG0922594.1 unnamed protein product [Notodromas monacha]
MSPRERHWKYRLSFFYPKEEDSGVFICTTPEGYSNSIEVNIAPVHCGALNPLDPQLEIHQEDDKMTAVANFSCPLGYILHGDSSVMCLANVTA